MAKDTWKLFDENSKKASKIAKLSQNEFKSYVDETKHEFNLSEIKPITVKALSEDMKLFKESLNICK